MGKKKPSKAQRKEAVILQNPVSIWKELADCIAGIKAEEEAERLKKEAEEARAAEELEENMKELEVRLEELVEENIEMKT